MAQLQRGHLLSLGLIGETSNDHPGLFDKHQLDKRGGGHHGLLVHKEDTLAPQMWYLSIIQNSSILKPIPRRHYTEKFF